MRYGILLALVLLLVAVPALAADERPPISPSVTAGGLTCFSITPVAADPEDASPPNCRELCAAEGAACTGVAVGAFSPPPNCDSRAISPAMASCSCCAVAK